MFLLNVVYVFDGSLPVRFREQQKTPCRVGRGIRFARRTNSTAARDFDGPSPVSFREQQKTPCRVFFVVGGERGIRTLGRVLADTRFPVVRLRPAQPSLQFIQFAPFQTPQYYITSIIVCQVFFSKL